MNGHTSIFSAILLRQTTFVTSILLSFSSFVFEIKHYLRKKCKAAALDTTYESSQLLWQRTEYSAKIQFRLKKHDLAVDISCVTMHVIGCITE